VVPEVQIFHWRGRDGGEAYKIKYTLLPIQIDNETIVIERDESHLDLTNNDVRNTEMPAS